MYNSGYSHENNIYKIQSAPNQEPARIPPINNFEMEEYTTGSYSTKVSRIIQIVFDLFIIIAVFAVFLFVYFLVEAKFRYFSCDESDIFYPYLEDTVPFWVVGIYGVLGPIIIIIGVEFLNGNFLWFQKEKTDRGRKFWISLYHALSLFVLGCAVVLCLTEIGKKWVGRLRPHFMEVCLPDYTTFACTRSAATGTIYNQISTKGNFCTGDPKKIKEARLSFPSGHASFSWYTMLFTIIYLEARWILIRFRYFKTVLQMTCFIAAFVTMLSRVSDYHHRGSDVIGGTVLGVIVAVGITCYVGRVLWVFDKRSNYGDFDLKARDVS